MTIRRQRRFAAVATLLVTGTGGPIAGTAADELFTPYSAEYKVKISVLSGELNTRLAITDEGYAATYHVEPRGLANIISNGEIKATSDFVATENGLRPVRHVTKDTLSKQKIQADLTFDWDTQSVAGTINGEPVEQALDGVVHDFVTLQYELVRDLRDSGAGESYVLFEPDELKVLNIRSVGTRDVKVPAGRYSVLGIQHQREGSSRSTTFWFAEELDYLPVIIERHRKGKLLMRAELRKYRPE